jgi:CheY-like chemotaxis protein
MAKIPTVLIADDEPLFVSSLARQIRREGLSFITDTTSEHVLELARTWHPELIVMDIHQRIDGRDLLSKLKKDPATRDIKVIVLSAEDNEYLRATCLELGAYDYEVKPYDRTVIQKIARLAHAAAAASSEDPAPASAA